MAGKNKPKATPEAKAANAAASKRGKRPPKPPKRKLVRSDRRILIDRARAHLNECARRLSELERELYTKYRSQAKTNDAEASPQLLALRTSIQVAQSAKDKARRDLELARELPIPEQPKKPPRQWAPKDYLTQKEAVLA